jgi:hypothetical protein
MSEQTVVAVSVILSGVVAAMWGWVIGRVICNLDGESSFEQTARSAAVGVGLALVCGLVPWFGYWGFVGAVACWPALLLSRKAFDVANSAPELQEEPQPRRYSTSSTNSMASIAALFGTIGAMVLTGQLATQSSPLVAVVGSAIGVVVIPYAVVGAFMLFACSLMVIFGVYLKRFANRLSCLANRISGSLSRDL